MVERVRPVYSFPKSKGDPPKPWNGSGQRPALGSLIERLLLRAALNFSQRLFFDGFKEMSMKGRQLLPVRGKESVAGLYKPLFLLILNFWHGDCLSK